MFIESETLVVWGIGFVAVVMLAAAAHWCVVRFAPPKWRHPWWVVAGTFAAGLGIVTLVDNSLDAPRALQALNSQVGLPATYTADASTLTLMENCSATLTNVVLADDVTRNDAGRLCLSGEPVSISGDARWSMSADGSVHISAEDRVSQLFPDPKPILGYGWNRGFLLASCDVSFATEYWAPVRN